MNQEKINELKSLIGKATPGPWKCDDIECTVENYAGDSIIIEPIELADAMYIAAVNPEAVDQMISENEEYARQFNYLRNFLDKAELHTPQDVARAAYNTINDLMRKLDEGRKESHAIIERLQKQIEWLDKRIFDLYHADYVPECVVGREMPIGYWQEIALKATERE